MQAGRLPMRAVCVCAQVGGLYGWAGHERMACFGAPAGGIIASEVGDVSGEVRGLPPLSQNEPERVDQFCGRTTMSFFTFRTSGTFLATRMACSFSACVRANPES